jgi:hypothetical protein
MGENDEVHEVVIEEGEELPPVKTNTRTRFVLKSLRPVPADERKRRREEWLKWVAKP